jgi:predicted ferric reductase
MKKTLLYLLFFVNLGSIVTLWYLGSNSLLLEGTPGILVALGRITGLLAEFFILLQLILIGRIRFIERQFGHDKLALLHRRVGLYVAGLIVVHPIFLSFGYGMFSEQSFFKQFISFLTTWDDIASALFGLILFSVAAILSINYLRKNLKYERWHFTHLFMYAGIFLALEHQTKTADVSSGAPLYYWTVLNYAVFGVLIAYRFLRPFYLLYKHRFKIARVEAESDDVVSIYVEGSDLEKFKFEAGQFAIINFLAKGMWTSHPFSFSAAPNGKTLRFTIKALGDFTEKARGLKPGIPVLIDGPLGHFTREKARTNKYLFIAGGVGITPIMGMIDALTKGQKQEDIVLIYGNKTATQIPFRSSLSKLPIKAHYVISDKNGSALENDMTPGYIDREKIERLSPDYLSRDIFLCGPPAMCESVVTELQTLGIEKSRIHFERFAF